MKKLFNSTIFLILSTITMSVATSAEMKIVTGHSSGTCDTANAQLLAFARIDTDIQLQMSNRLDVMNSRPKNFQRVSDFNERVYEVHGSYDPDLCFGGKKAWAEAAFVDKKRIDEEWFLTIESTFSNPRIDWNIPGEHKFSDEIAWSKAFEKATERAMIFCKKGFIGEPVILSKLKKIFTGSLWYDLFSTEAKFNCIK